MKIAIVGAGNMGRAIIDGLLDKVDASDIIISTPENPTLQPWVNQRAFTIVHDNTELLALDLDYLIFTTPAKVTLNIMQTLAKLPAKTTILSAAAGIRLADMKDAFTNQHNLAIFMPNTPVAINAGTIGTTILADNASAKEAILNLLNVLGDTFEISETDFGIFGTVAGCGPAFVDIFMEALSDAAVANGLNRQLSYQVISSMLKGTASLQMATGQTPAELKNTVTSPGGTTIKGVLALEAQPFRRAVTDAIDAANHN